MAGVSSYNARVAFRAQGTWSIDQEGIRTLPCLQVAFTASGKTLVETWTLRCRVGDDTPVVTEREMHSMPERKVPRFARRMGVPGVRLPLIEPTPDMRSELRTAVANAAGGRGWFGMFGSHRTLRESHLLHDYLTQNPVV